MSSETSAQWPVVAPGFMYIVKMGDYTHILQPADQKSSEHLNLAQVALRDINVARKLLDERGPFLLLDKQEKMDELITDTETAINRVIKVLEPARVQHISEQSIRFNTRNPWALEDSPKSAATFGRLRITHDALKTVVHDLSNIEATVQFDDCNDRAEATPAIGSAAPTESGTIPKTPSKDAINPLTWKRSRRANRHSNSTSSAEPLPKPDCDGDAIFSPVSPEEKLTKVPTGEFGRLHRDSISEPDSSLQPDSAVDHASDISADRLPVIHELEGGNSIVQLGPVRPLNTALDKMKGADSGLGKSKAPGESEPIREQTIADNHSIQTPRNKHNRIASTPPALRVTPPTLKQNNRVKRETFEELRQRNKQDKQPPQSVISNGVLPSSQSAQTMPSPPPHTMDNNVTRAPGRFRSLKARLPTGSTNKEGKGLPSGPANGSTAPIRDAPSMSKPTEAVPEDFSPALNYTNQAVIQEGHGYGGETEPSMKSATYPPVRTQLQLPMMPSDPSNTSGTPTGILSPSRIQMSPLEQMQSPNAPDSAPTSPLRPHERDHQIFDIDPVLQRLPSLLRIARPLGDGEPRPRSRSRSAKPDELHFPENALPAPVKEPLDRSVTAPPLSQSGLQGDRTFSHGTPVREELAHLRSMSDTAVPQVNSTHGPIPPRKPLPYRNSPLPSREPSPHVVSRVTTPLPERRQSEVIQSLSNVPQRSKATSGPPSPIQSDHPTDMTPQIPKAPSTQSLQVQVPSSAASSRKSSISAEGAMNGKSTTPAKPLKANGLAMNPPEIPDRGTSAYQAQKMAHETQAIQPSQTMAYAPDYRSPAWQQSRHYFDPGHNVQLEVAPPSNTTNGSRFRDQDVQPRSALVNATRSKTIPEPTVIDHTATNQAEQPRRASEQATASFQTPQQPQVPVPPQQLQPMSLPPPPPPPPPQQDMQAANMPPPPRPAPSPKPSEHSRSNFLQHQAAKLHARQQSNQVPLLPPAPPFQPQQVQQMRPEQVLPLRVFLTPHHPAGMARPPPAGTPNNTGCQIAPESFHHAATTTPTPPEKQQQSVRDRELLGMKLFRPSKDKRSKSPRGASVAVAPQANQFSQPQTQAQAQPQQQQQMKQLQPQPQFQPQSQYQQQPTQPARGPIQPQSATQTHECHCDSTTDISTDALKPTSSESLNDLIKMNNQLAQNVPTIPTAPMRNDERVLAPPIAPSSQGLDKGKGPEQIPVQMYGQREAGGEGSGQVGQVQGQWQGAQHKKKKSWLVHQATKIAEKTGN